MAEYRLPVVGGRTLLIRPCEGGPRPQVQVAILSTRGNITEAVNVETTDILGFCRAMGKVGLEANASHDDAARKERTEADRRRGEALERNPWLRGLRPDRERRGLR